MIHLGKADQKAIGMAWNGWPHLIVLLFAFFAGVFAGFFLAHLGGESSELSDFLKEHFGYAAQNSLDVSFVSVLWDCLRWPLTIIVFSFSALGVFVIPTLFLMRGLLLSYSVSCFAVLLQREGVAVGITLFFVASIFVVPVLFLFGCEGLRAACFRLPGSAPGSNGRVFRLEVLLIGFGILAVAIAVQWVAIPAVFTSVCIRLF